MPTRFAVLGDGAWGTAMAVLLSARPEHEVTLWSARVENGRLLRERRENVRLLPGVAIPTRIVLTTDPREAVEGADIWIAAIPTVYLRHTLERFAPLAPCGRPVLSLAKGLENETFLRPTQIIAELVKPTTVAALSGPNHAEEISHGLPATTVVASEDVEFAHWLQQRLSTDRFRIYTTFDVVGVELAGALKNVIAIAAGIGDGLGLGDNAKSALLTRGLVEIARFGVALGADHETFFGLAGMGDLITTCISPHGRNRRVGERLGRGESMDAILASMSMVAEGVFTARSVHEKAAKMGIDMPITTEVYRVLYQAKSPLAAVTDLMVREPKSERPHSIE